AARRGGAARGPRSPRGARGRDGSDRDGLDEAGPPTGSALGGTGSLRVRCVGRRDLGARGGRRPTRSAAGQTIPGADPLRGRPVDRGGEGGVPGPGGEGLGGCPETATGRGPSYRSRSPALPDRGGALRCAAPQDRPEMRNPGK